MPAEPADPPAPPLPLSAAAAPAAPRPSDWVRRSRLQLTRKRVAMIGVAVLAFLALSFLLARWLQVENIERDDDLELIQAETRGDARAMLAMLHDCPPGSPCAGSVKADTVNSRLLRTGAVKILQLESNTAYSLTGSTGETRLAWTVLGKLPVVQCIDVRRTGNVLSGIDVTLLRVSTPIVNEANC